MPASVFAGDCFFDAGGDDGAEAAERWSKDGSPAKRDLHLATKEVVRCWDLYRSWAGRPSTLDPVDAARIARVTLEVRTSAADVLRAAHRNGVSFLKLDVLPASYLKKTTIDIALSKAAVSVRKLKDEKSVIRRGFLSDAEDVDEAARDAILAAYRALPPDPDAGDVEPEANEIIVFAVTCAQTRSRDGLSTWPSRMTSVIDAAATALGLRSGPEAA